ncbi:molecular chaperone DnaJ [Thermoleophilia bacterium SCSIO 60948]|nr:molecular chaperone DnaJ [Thermoleophilia bacterium SCSIO 60948]
MTVPRDLYEVLGVERDADDAQIKRSFRRLARELHPDVNKDDPNAEERFREAASAYEVLSDPDKRSTYDRFGHDGLRSGGYSPGGATGGFEDILSSLFGQGGGAFGDLFGFGGSRGGPQQGADLAMELEIELADVLTGVEREVSFDAVSTCEHCNGNGAEPGTPIKTCETCEGRGQVRRVMRTAFGQMVQAQACPTCGGEGKIPETPCEVCGGEGRLLRERTWEVEVPTGIESGQRIRIQGAGQAGERGGGSGDLFVLIRVAEDERFERQGSDLISHVEIPATRAMLGGEVTVETLDGEHELSFEAGTQPGERLRIKGAGLPSLRGPRRGDQFVICDVVVPSALDESQREAVSSLDESLTERNLNGSRARGGLRERLRRATRGR